MCSDLLQLAPESRGLSQAENCYVKVSKLFLLKMITLFIQDNFECHLVNLLSFTKQLFSSQIEISHVIQQPCKANYSFKQKLAFADKN